MAECGKSDKLETQDLLEAVCGPGEGRRDVRQEGGAGTETNVTQTLVRGAADRRLLDLPHRLLLHLRGLANLYSTYFRKLKLGKLWYLRFLEENNSLLWRVFEYRPCDVLLGAFDAAATHAGASRGSHLDKRHTLK